MQVAGASFRQLQGPLQHALASAAQPQACAADSSAAQAGIVPDSHLQLDVLQGLPLLPTLNGWLLGYLVVYLVRVYLLQVLLHVLATLQCHPLAEASCRCRGTDKYCTASSCELSTCKKMSTLRRVAKGRQYCILQVRTAHEVDVAARHLSSVTLLHCAAYTDCSIADVTPQVCREWNPLCILA